MPKSKTYSNYPFWIVIFSNTVALSMYVLGLFIILRLGWMVALIYILYILFLEWKTLRQYCINCYYYGKNCALGKGRVCSCFFKKGNISKFIHSKTTWRDMIPGLLVTLIPFLLGIVLLMIKFDIWILLAMILLFFLTTSGNAFMHINLICKYCKQRILGCPAERLFRKK